jgi:hypothetical protein
MVSSPAWASGPQVDRRTFRQAHFASSERLIGAMEEVQYALRSQDLAASAYSRHVDRH